MDFNAFLNEKLFENASKKAQIESQEKYLSQLSATKKDLASTGTPVHHIDNQIDQITNVLNRRRSGTHHWHGGIVRIDEEVLAGVTFWKLMGRDGTVFHIPVKDTYGIIKIPHNWQQFPNLKHPMSKLLEYRQEIFGSSLINFITHSENRTADIVPFKTIKDHHEYYLIRRRDSGLLATVGGHIDEGELQDPSIAARRELYEETRCYPMLLRVLPIGWVKASASNENLTPSAEYNSWTMPYIALVSPDTQMKPSDDAIDGEWLGIDYMPSELHFAHHRKIIKEACNYLPSILKEFGKY